MGITVSPSADNNFRTCAAWQRRVAKRAQCTIHECRAYSGVKWALNLLPTIVQAAPFEGGAGMALPTDASLAKEFDIAFLGSGFVNSIVAS